MAFAHVLEDGYKSSLTKFLSRSSSTRLPRRPGPGWGDTLLLIADAKAEVACVAMGQVRLAVAEKLGLIPENQWNLLWVTEFPFFERDDEGHLCPPITPSPCPWRRTWISSIPTRPPSALTATISCSTAWSWAAAASVFHDKQLQNRMFEQLGMTAEQIDSKFGYLVNAFSTGRRPTAGSPTAWTGW